MNSIIQFGSSTPSQRPVSKISVLSRYTQKATKRSSKQPTAKDVTLHPNASCRSLGWNNPDWNTRVDIPKTMLITNKSNQHFRDQLGGLNASEKYALQIRCKATLEDVPKNNAITISGVNGRIIPKPENQGRCGGEIPLYILFHHHLRVTSVEAPEKWWFEDDDFSYWGGLCPGVFAVKLWGGVYI